MSDEEWTQSISPDMRQNIRSAISIVGGSGDEDVILDVLADLVGQHAINEVGEAAITKEIERLLEGRVK